MGKKTKKEKIWSIQYLYLTMWPYKLKINVPDIPKRALEAFALQAYRNGVITEYEVQKLLKISSRMELDAFLKESNAYIDYTEKDLQQDIENIRKSLLK